MSFPEILLNLLTIVQAKMSFTFNPSKIVRDFWLDLLNFSNRCGWDYKDALL